MVGALQVTRTIFLDLVDLIINNSWKDENNSLRHQDVLPNVKYCQIMLKLSGWPSNTIRRSNLRMVVNTAPMLTKSMELGSTDLRQELSVAHPKIPSELCHGEVAV